MDKNCTIKNLTSNNQRVYATIILPVGAKNLKIFTSGGTGNVDMYVKRGGWPTTTVYGLASRSTGNNEEASFATPVANSWYYVMLTPQQAFSGVTLSATYD